jgi:hypothetical protein
MTEDSRLAAWLNQLPPHDRLNVCRRILASLKPEDRAILLAEQAALPAPLSDHAFRHMDPDAPVRSKTLGRPQEALG